MVAACLCVEYIEEIDIFLQFNIQRSQLDYILQGGGGVSANKLQILHKCVQHTEWS